MINTVHFRNDIKQIVREPIMLILLISPLFIVIVFKLILLLLIPYIQQYISLDISMYNSYIISLSLILTPGILGIITGFMMLDDRDGKIAELMSITPLGYTGYLVNRLSFSGFLTIVYTFITYYLLNIYHIKFFTLIYLSILLSIYSMIIGMILFSIASDKVKGLTYAKVLNAIILFAFTDLFTIKWLTSLSRFFPTYWITRIIKDQDDISTYAVALLVYLIWLFIILIRD